MEFVLCWGPLGEGVFVVVPLISNRRDSSEAFQRSDLSHIAFKPKLEKPERLEPVGKYTE